jgi:Heterokaryon incompatibility protein (HET)
MPHKRIYFDGKVVPVPISPYQYKPLIQTENEFRLVELQPNHSHHIKATLRHYSLLDPPSYTALSYQCGDPRNLKWIEVDHFEVPIPINLDLALRQLRSHGCELLWVDCLCIDQNNEDERNSQITRMATIYQEASTVAVWLGREECGSAKVMQMLQSMRDRRSKRPQQPTLPNISHLQSLHTELAEFLRRPYWTRVWIIQEIVAGARVRLFCGSLDAEWDDLYVVVMKLLREDWLRDHRLTSVRQLCESRLNRIEGKAVGLLEQLCDNSSSSASDPRDRVFATLGLCFDRANYMSEVKYGWFETELCMRMTRSAISSKRCLDIISIGPARKDRRPDYDLPSWCPDYLNFPSGKASRHLAKYLSGQDERFRAGKLCRRWNATNTMHPTYSINGNALHVKGYRIGEVRSLANIVGENSTPWYRAVSHPRCSNRDIFEALSRMLFLYNKEYAKHIDSPILLNRLFEFDANLDDYKNLPEDFDTVRNWRDLNQNFMILGKTLKKRCTEWNAEWLKLRDTNANVIQPHLPRSGTHLTHHKPHAIAFKDRSLENPTVDVAGALTALADLIKERLRLMITSEEQVGWAHHNAELGDEIFLLEGCNMPILLRRTLDKERQHAYSVVGHAYVDEVMNGELWSTLEPQQLVDLHIY